MLVQQWQAEPAFFFFYAPPEGQAAATVKPLEVFLRRACWFGSECPTPLPCERFRNSRIFALLVRFFFPSFFHSRVIGACLVTTTSLWRCVNVRTTTPQSRALISYYTVALAQLLTRSCGFTQQAPEGVLHCVLGRATYFAKKKLRVSFSPKARTKIVEPLHVCRRRKKRFEASKQSLEWFSGICPRKYIIFWPPAAPTRGVRNRRRSPNQCHASQQWRGEGAFSACVELL